MSSLRIVDTIGTKIQKNINKYKNKPKVKNLNEATPDCIDNDYCQMEPTYFSSEGCNIQN